jgi:P-type Mg2+ transporter
MMVVSKKESNLRVHDSDSTMIAEKLFEASRQDAEAILHEMGVSRHGFSCLEAANRLESFGMNIISHEKPDSLLKRLLKAFVNPFTVVLFILALVSLFTDVIFSNEKNPRSVILICSMVLLSGILRFVQESRSNKAAEKLKALVHTTAMVERGEKGTIEIPLSNIVPGDIVHISAGDLIPADIRLVESKDLFINQSTLTGESEPVEKFHTASEQIYSTLTDLPNIAFMGSYAVSGTAVAVVLSTGDMTCFGSMAKAITGKHVVTSFDKGINEVSWVLVRFIIFMVPVVFFINGFTKGNWLEAFLFALSVAVGITPEMLPMIVTTNLAKGAVAMARKKTVVKHLDAMQNFGAMDILCTDKTGTITQNRVVLEYHWNVYMEDDKRVLRHAFLNSHYQTGLKNLMDVAILAHSEEEGFEALMQKFVKVDEIPFDFNRRRMSVVIRDNTNGKTQMITKGAVEEMLSVCSFAEYEGQHEPLSEELLVKIHDTVDKMNSQGMRVIAVAQKDDPPATGEFSVKDENEMVLMGYLAFLDPPKDTAASAIKSLNEDGIVVKVLTGDNEAIARCICRQVGMETDKILLGSEIDSMDDATLQQQAAEINIYAKLTPQQKARIVRVLRSTDHTVGFMGDGINDAAAMREADVAISVDSAVDIAKESADIILLEKDLKVLGEGVIEGRKTFGNIIKYIKMTASSNFGNMFSVVTASAFLPFLPMLPIQILVLNFIYDISCTAIPWDHMDPEYIRKPRKWDASSIGRFMVWIGPTSSVFDVTTYIIMFFIICPAVCGGPFGAPGVNQVLFISLFNAGWFVESLWSQTLVIHMIRTPKIPFLQSRAAAPLLFLTTLSITVGTLIPYTSFGKAIGMSGMPAMYFPWLIGMILCYMALATFLKTMYIRRYSELL